MSDYNSIGGFVQDKAAMMRQREIAASVNPGIPDGILWRRDMENAPRDGRVILVWNGTANLARWGSTYLRSSGVSLVGSTWMQFPFSGAQISPTHWAFINEP